MLVRHFVSSTQCLCADQAFAVLGCAVQQSCTPKQRTAVKGATWQARDVCM